MCIAYDDVGQKKHDPMVILHTMMSEVRRMTNVGRKKHDPMVILHTMMSVVRGFLVVRGMTVGRMKHYPIVILHMISVVKGTTNMRVAHVSRVYSLQ